MIPRRGAADNAARCRRACKGREHRSSYRVGGAHGRLPGSSRNREDGRRIDVAERAKSLASGGCVGMMRLTNLRVALVCGSLPLLLSCDGGGSTDPLAPPAALATVSATASSHTEVLLTWAPPAGDVVEFRIERATGSAAFAQIAAVPGNVTSYRDVGLSPGTLYRYRVRACGGGGCSDFTTATVTTNAELTINTSSLPDAVRGESYSTGLSAVGGAGVYTWTVASGSLPAGLTLSTGG